MSPPRRLVPAVLRRPFVQDLVLALVLTGFSLHALWHATPVVELEFREPDLLGVVLTVAGAGGVALRSRAPVTSLLVTAFGTFGVAHLVYSQGIGGFAPLFALYSVAVGRSFRTSLGLTLVTAGGLSSVLVFGPYEPTPGEWASNLVACLAVWTLGRSVRTRRQHARTVELRNLAMQEVREAETRTLLVEERARTVREMQDLVAHHLTEVSVQIAAARRVLARDPGSAEVLLQGAESTGRAALEEMRRAGGLLGAEPAASLRPQPTLDDLDELVASQRAAGLQVGYRRTGRLAGAAPGLELTVFRLVEEALRQIRGRAAAAPSGLPIEISLDALDGELDVSVTCGPDRDTVSWEHEHEHEAEGLPLLLRLRARAAAYGGELSLGHRRDGSFRLSGRFPLEPVTHPSPGAGQ
ncbi:sensor histidine kinase [Nocardioides ferulae]|uniref:sensor histidine kinase n=1 Tax=Nocardioides ferulae TaxID=2340821 RepID=UPI000EB1F400|nr:histidine kinase [Nocardioides ferulae]